MLIFKGFHGDVDGTQLIFRQVKKYINISKQKHNKLQVLKKLKQIGVK